MSGDTFTLLNAWDDGRARRELTRCCGAGRWVEGMLAIRPFASQEALLHGAGTVWDGLGPDDQREAFSHHPAIGAAAGELDRMPAGSRAWSEAEQAGVQGAAETVRQELARLNLAYRERFGFTFIVCASGKSASEMLDLLRARIGNPADQELAVAAAEQAKITRLRLEKLTP